MIYTETPTISATPEAGARTTKKKTKKIKKTLYERLGGDASINMIVSSFFDECVEDPDLSPFFRHSSLTALKVHQVKLFVVLFGPDEEKPDQEDLVDFMLFSHTRLFRDQGLDETHFDIMMNCLVQALETFQIDQHLIDESVGIFLPLRESFEYGAKVASQEKTMEADELFDLPKATAHTMASSSPAVLPEPSAIDIPDWLSKTLKEKSKQPSVRAWTCELTDRFGSDGDEVIADTFLDMPFMNHHVYLVSLLQLAFLPEKGVDEAHLNGLLHMLQTPRGPNTAPLSRALFDRMIIQFSETCASMRMETYVIREAEQKLISHRDTFEDTTGKVIETVGGVTSPHILRKVNKVEIDTSGMQRRRHRRERHKKAKSTSSCGSLGTSSTASNSHGSTGSKSKGSRLLSWSRIFASSKK